MNNLTSVDLEKAKNEIDRRVNIQNQYFQNKRTKIKLESITSGFDRHGNMIHINDEVDFCKSSPGGLGVGRIAGIMYRSYEGYDNVSKDNACEFIIKTSGQRWTKKDSNDIILRRHCLSSRTI